MTHMRRTLFAALMLVAFAAVPALAQDAGLDSFDCVAEPAQTVKLGSATTGLLASLAIGRGDRVTAGEEIARLDSSVEEASVSLAAAEADAGEAISAQQTRLSVAEAALDRARQLQQGGSATQSRVDELEAAVEIARLDLDTERRKTRIAALELARQQAILERLTIRSPIDGVVADVGARVGEFIRQDSTVATIVQTDPLNVDAYLPTALWSATSVGQVVRVTLDRPSEVTLDGRIIVVDSVFDTASDTFGVRVELANPGNAIPGGQRCRLALSTP